MIDLNTILNTALTQALNEALKPLLERIATIESSVQHLDVWSTSTGNVLTDRLTALEARVMATTEPDSSALDDLIDDRISNYLDNDDLTSRIDVDGLDLHRAIEEALDGMDLTDIVSATVRDLLADARITL